MTHSEKKKNTPRVFIMPQNCRSDRAKDVGVLPAADEFGETAV